VTGTTRFFLIDTPDQHVDLTLEMDTLFLDGSLDLWWLSHF
jgi:hypothetical protein